MPTLRLCVPALAAPSASIPQLRALVARAFESAKELSGTTPLDTATLSRDGFDRLAAYLHAALFCTSLLGQPADGSTAAAVDADHARELAAQLPPEWGVDEDAISRSYAEAAADAPTIDELGRLPSDEVVHLVVSNAMAALAPPRLEGPEQLYISDAASPGGGSAAGAGAGVLGAVSLTPVPEGSERGTFTSTDWGGAATGGDMGLASVRHPPCCDLPSCTRLAVTCLVAPALL